MSNDTDDRRLGRLIGSLAEYAVCLLDEYGRVQSWNAGARRLFGYAEADAVGRHVSLLFEARADSVEAALREAARSGSHEAEAWCVRSNGARFCGLVTFRAEDGGRTGFGLIVRDVTDRCRREETLRESEQRLRALAENATEAILTIDSNDRIMFANPAAARIFGYDLEELVLMPFTAMIPERYRQAHRDGMERFARSRQRHIPWDGIELPGLRQDGEEVPLEITFSFYERGGELFFSGIMRDISERKRSEAALRQSELRFHQITTAIREVFYITDPVRDRMLYVSPGYEEIWGRPGEELSRDPRAFVAAIDEADRQRVADALLVQRRGEPTEVEYRIHRPDGEVRWILDRSFPVHDAQGRLLNVVGAAADITASKVAQQRLQALADDNAALYEAAEGARQEAERRAAEEAALRRAAELVNASFTVEEVIEQIAESALDAVQADGAYIERVDPGAGEVVVVATAGSRTPEVGARAEYAGSYAQLVLETETPELVERLSDAGRPLPGDLETQCGDCFALIVPMRDSGEAIGTLVLLRDAARPPTEDEVARAHAFANLGSLAFRKVHLLHETEKRREELERVMESRERLIRGFSHDLKNPLGAADGYAQLLADGMLGPLTEKQRKSLGRMRGALHSALGLIDDIVDLARAEAGQIDIRREPVDVRDVVREVVGEHEARASAAGLALSCTLPAELSLIESDSRRVRQVLGNLLGNALKYTPAGGRVELEVSLRERQAAAGTAVVVDVADTGPGIPADKRDAVFEEFTRLDPAEGDGAGLGLAISRRIARALSGEVTVAEREGGGAVFTLWLPVT